jgi:hypothetical protein
MFPSLRELYVVPFSLIHLLQCKGKVKFCLDQTWRTHFPRRCELLNRVEVGLLYSQLRREHILQTDLGEGAYNLNTEGKFWNDRNIVYPYTWYLIYWINILDNFRLTINVKSERKVPKDSSVFWDWTPCSPLKVNRCFGETHRFCFRSVKTKQIKEQAWQQWEEELSLYFLAWLIVCSWGWRQYVPPNYRLTFIGLSRDVRTSQPSYDMRSWYVCNESCK